MLNSRSFRFFLQISLKFNNFLRKLSIPFYFSKRITHNWENFQKRYPGTSRKSLRLLSGKMHLNDDKKIYSCRAVPGNKAFSGTINLKVQPVTEMLRLGVIIETAQVIILYWRDKVHVMLTGKSTAKSCANSKFRTRLIHGKTTLNINTEWYKKALP